MLHWFAQLKVMGMRVLVVLVYRLSLDIAFFPPPVHNRDFLKLYLIFQFEVIFSYFFQCRFCYGHNLGHFINYMVNDFIGVENFRLLLTCPLFSVCWALPSMTMERGLDLFC